MLVVQNPLTRWVGLGWMVAGLVGYAVYRRRFVHAPVREIEKAAPAFGTGACPRVPRPPRARDPRSALRRRDGRRLPPRGGASCSRIIALNVVEVPLDCPLTDRFPELEATGNAELDEAVAIGDSYGVRVLTRLDRAHAAGPAIVAEADARNAEIIVLGSPRRHLTARQTAVFGKTVDYVLKHAHCRVMIATEGAAG